MSTIRATYVQHGSSPVPNITLDGSGNVTVASGLTFNSSLSIPSGSVGTPGLSFASDTDTGFYSATPNTIAIATSGTAAVTVDASQRVGIGTSAPSYLGELVGGSGGSETTLLQLRSNATDTNTATSIRLTNATAAGSTSSCEIASIRGPGGVSSLALRTSDGSTPATRVTVDSSGRVGIGTSSPSQKLQVSGAGSQYTSIISTDSDNTGVLFGDAAKVDEGYILYANSDNSLRFGANGGNERGRFDSSGRLLVGTSSARGRYTLQLEGNSDSATDVGEIWMGRPLADGSISSGTGLGKVYFGGQSGGVGAKIEGIADAQWGTNDYPGRLVFSTTADGASSPTERMRIKENGFVKISSSNSYYSEPGTYHELRTNTNNSLVAILSHHGTSGQQYGLSVRTADDQNDAIRYFFQGTGGTTDRVTIRSNGGLANYQANDVNLSDINTKKDISPAADTWDCIKQWEIVNYRYKDQPDDADLNLGVIAQQVAESCPEVITVFQEAKEATETEPAQEERLGVKEQQMYWMAIKALQEAQVRIEALEAEVAALKAA